MELFITRFHALDNLPRYIENVEWIDSVEKQESLLNRTVLDSFAKQHRLPAYQIQALLEAIVRTCESERIEVSETVYELLAASLTCSKTEEKYFGSYRLVETGKMIAFETDSSSGSAFVKDGSTGFCTWEAGKCLAWFLCREQTRACGSILELGCGTGVTGALVSQVLGDQITKYIFSDYHESTLDQARRNCETNKVFGEFVRINILEPNPTACVHADMVIAADILYDEDLCLGLVEWLANPSTCAFKVAYIMSTIRTDKTYGTFKAALEKRSDQLEWSVVYRMLMSEWIVEARSTGGSDWALFMDSNKRLFDPEIELVRIVRRS